MKRPHRIPDRFGDIVHPMNLTPEDGTLSAQTRLVLGGGHTLEVMPRSQAAIVTLRSPRDQVLLSFEVVITPAGALVRGQAAALEIEASRVATRCDEFLVDARERIELRSAGEIIHQAAGSVHVAASDIDIGASIGAVRVRANDDVQLLGEQVLLNCDRPAPMPEWVAPPVPPPVLLERQDGTGDVELIRELAVLPSPDATR